MINFEIQNDADPIATLPTDTLAEIENLERKGRALDAAAGDFMRAHSYEHEQIARKRDELWDDLSTRFNLDLNKYRYSIVSVKGEPSIVKTGDR